MFFIQVGIHYRTSDLSIREKFVFPQDKSGLMKANQQLNKMPHIVENVIVSTCNRTEIYAVVDEKAKAYDAIILFLADTFSIARKHVEQLIEFRLEEQAITHLLNVTAGLDSMVVGETEILGQIKHAFFSAQEAKTTQKICNEFFKRAITLGKQAQHHTRIASYPLSVSHLAVQLCADNVPHFHQGPVLVVGAGSIGMRTVNQLLASGVENIVLINRTLEKAQAQVTDQRVKVDAYETLYEQLSVAKIVFFAVQKDTYVFTKQMAKKLQKDRNKQALWLVDLAVPRNIDPAIQTMDHMFVYDMDHLQGEINRNETGRKIAAKKIAGLVQMKLKDIKEWRKTIHIHPLLHAFQRKGSGIQAEVLASINRKIPSLTDREKKVIEKHTASIVNQLMKEPIKQLKQASSQEDDSLFLQHFKQIHGINDLQVEEGNKQNLREKPKLTGHHAPEKITSFTNQQVGGS